MVGLAGELLLQLNDEITSHVQHPRVPGRLNVADIWMVAVRYAIVVLSFSPEPQPGRRRAFWFLGVNSQENDGPFHTRLNKCFQK